MPKNKQATNNPHRANDGHYNRKSSLIFWAIVIAVVVLIYAGLIFIAVKHPYLNERVKLGTESGLALAVLIAIIVQVFINHRQWQHAERGLRMSQRAYVGLSDDPKLIPIKANENPRVVITLTNNGKTPARDVEFRYRFSSDSGSEKPYINKKIIPIISAGMSKNVICNWKGQLFEDYFWQEIDHGFCRIQFIGKLSYVDEWGELHDKIPPFVYVSVSNHELREDYEGDEDYVFPDFIVEIDEDMYCPSYEDNVPEPPEEDRLDF